MPYYYEPSYKYSHLINEVLKEEGCQDECFKNISCVQYVYNIETMDCFLKESLNIAKGIPVKFNSNINVKSIKSKLF